MNSWHKKVEARIT